jgi:hypothetical protein
VIDIIFTTIEVAFGGISNIQFVFHGMRPSEDNRGQRLKTEVSMAPSVSIMQSKKQIEDIEMAIDVCRDSHRPTIDGVRNRQISSGVIIDWKEFEES